MSAQYELFLNTRSDNLPISGHHLDTVMKAEVAHAAGYEHDLTVLEKNLAADLKEARAKIASYNEKEATAQDYVALAKELETHKIPSIEQASAKTIEVIHEIEWKLPGIRSQLVEIRKAYDLGRRRAQTLQAEMEWKAKTDFQQWRSTLLGKSPLSPQQVKREWLKLLRRLFLVVFSLFISLYICWVAAYRNP